MKYTAAVFDLDGTLLDTLGDIAGAVNRALASRNLQVYSKEEYKMMIGHGLKHLVKAAVKGTCPDLEEDPGLYTRAMEEYRSSPCENTSLYPGISRVLDFLSVRGVAMSILSNKEDALVQIITKNLLKDWDFTVVLGRRDDFPQKPDPASLIDIIKAMNVQKEKVLYIGDSEIDIKTGKNAGITSVGVSWGYRDPSLLSSEGADIVVASPEDLIELFIEEEL